MEELDKSKVLIKNGQRIVVNSDGSITRPDCYIKAKRVERNYGANQGSGYRSVGIGKGLFQVHRLVAEAFLPDFNPDWWVDHQNGDKSDNRLRNLRQFETKSEHNRAFQKKQEGSTSKYRGVSWIKARGRWLAQIKTDKKRYIGSFDNEQAAAIAYDRAAEEAGFDEQALNRTNHPELALLSGAY